MSSSRPVEQEDESCDNHHDDHLSNHTISMRAALNHCRDLLRNSTLDISSLHPDPELASDAWNAAQRISQQRQEALEDVSKNFAIPTVVFEESMSVLNFRKQFLHANRPCLIQGLPHFSQASTQWRRTKDSEINSDWFVQNLGEDILLPVRQRAGEELDDQGRAQECATIEIPLSAWLHNSSPDLYLKDWHLQKQWEKYHTSPLYTVPDCFGTDLLNNFLLKFTNGDYRFVYWGPPGSQTPVHSDVLHSFSWSHNVVGKKKWTFHMGGEQKQHLIVLIQNAGETVFVPSTMRHSVENLCETLSINHNWITTANIDQTWDCLTNEMTLVDVELKKWGNSSSWDAKEFMLRGCVGLDVTAFFFMVLTEQLELLTGERNDDDWERFFDIFRLHQVLEMLSKPSVHLQERLTSVLEQDTLALDAMDTAKTAMRVVNKVLVDIGL